MPAEDDNSNNPEMGPDKAAEDKQTDTFMNLMKQWYAYSSDIVNFLLTSAQNISKFPFGSPAAGDGPKVQADDDSWQNYIQNMNRFINDLKTSFTHNASQMEEMLGRWKSFQDAMDSYFQSNGESKSPLPIPQELWTKWLEYADSMNRNLSYFYYNLQPRQQGRSVFEALTGKSIGSGKGFDTIENIDDKSLAEMNEIYSRYYAELSRELMAANEAVAFKSGSAVDKSTEVVEKWVVLYDKFLQELIRTRAFNLILNENMKLSMDSKKQLDDALESHWKVLCMPTRSDIMELHRAIHDLQIRLNRLTMMFVESEKKGGRNHDDTSGTDDGIQPETHP